MKIPTHRSPWKGILVFCLLVSLGWQVFPLSTAAKSPAATLAQAAPPDPNSPTATVVTVSRPVLTPLYSNDMCASGWFRYSNTFNNYAFLSLNVGLASDSHNSAEWRPVLPDAGKWEVEVFIPKHGQISWAACPPDPAKTISKDTSHATYTIHHANGQTTVALDQYPLSNVWVSLGRYPFAAGETGYVTLNDVTGETNKTTTVSYSAMRFTYKPYVVHLPVMRSIFPAVMLDAAWTAATGGHAVRSFFQGEAIQYAGSGRNTNNAPATAELTWSVSGSCPAIGPFNSTYSELVTVPAGNWTHAYTAPTPTCTGFFTYTLQVNYNNRIFTDDALFVVSDPGAGTILSLEPAFDKCEIPVLSDLQTWWDSSPYRAINLYIGGVHRACNNIGLNVSWLRGASQQGWTFIPTWVGPQAPCAVPPYTHKISTDVVTAKAQGRAEADQADSAASDIGLPQDAVIYYDLESYGGSSVPDSCRNGVKSFIDGWVERLHELGKKAGAYGSPSGSNMLDWTTITHVPDQVWIAVWYQTYYYDPDANVSVPYLSDSLWGNHQRIRQYTGSHAETWGNRTLSSIDSNIIDGAVAALPQKITSGESSGNRSGSLPGTAKWSQDVRLISPTAGWSLVGGRLLWTANAGKAWSELTPSTVFSETLAATFLDERQGWALGSSPDGVALLRTDSAGETWQSLPLPNLGLDSFQVASMQFTDSQNGWIVLRLPSSSNFSLGRLLRTADGGKTWEQLPAPLGEPARFADAQRGWMAGGPGGNEIYATQDGGRTWEPVLLPVESASGQAFPGLPVFSDAMNGLLPVATTGSEGPGLDLFRSADGGETWRLADHVSLEGQPAPSSAPLALLADAGRWLVALPGVNQLYTSAAGERLAALPATNLPGGMIDLQISASGTGWARTLNGICQGEKPARSQASPGGEANFHCELRSQLWLTRDGGATWEEITP